MSDNIPLSEIKTLDVNITQEDNATIEKSPQAPASRYVKHKKYKYLNNGNKPVEKVLYHGEHGRMDAYNSLIVRDETNIPSFYIHFHTIGEYEQYYAGRHNYHTHEVIPGDLPYKPVFDIDNGTPELLEEIIEAIECAFDELYGITPTIIDCDSSGPEKFSHHLVVTNYLFADYLQAKAFYDYLLEEELLSPDAIKILDDKLYSSSHPLRIAGATKNGRTKRLPHGATLKDSLVTCRVDANGKTLPVLPRRPVSEPKAVDPSFAELPIPEEAQANLDLTMWRYRNSEGNMHNFDRRKAGVCYICPPDAEGKQPFHTSDNMWLSVYPDQVLMFCRRDGRKNKGYIVLWRDPTAEPRGKGKLAGFSDDDDLLPILPPPPAIDDNVEPVDAAALPPPPPPIEADNAGNADNPPPHQQQQEQLPTFNTITEVLDYFARRPHKPRATTIAEVKQALLQVYRYWEKGANSTACLLIGGDNIIDVQKQSSFLESKRKDMIHVSDGRSFSIAKLIEAYAADFRVSDIVFDPKRGQFDGGIANLFVGFRAAKLPPVPENVRQEVIAGFQRILTHIREVWCCNDENIYSYVLDWIATVLRGEKTGTVILLYGAEGAGKNVITCFLRDKIVGPAHSTDCDDIRHLTGTFNAQYANKLLTVIDELANAGSGQQFISTFEKMKNRITNSRLKVERKGVDSFTVADYNNYIITTNNKRAVRVSSRDRRYTMLEVSDCKKDNTVYFDTLRNDTEKGPLVDHIAKYTYDYFTKDHQITNNVSAALLTPLKESIATEIIDSVEEFAADIKYSRPEVAKTEMYEHYEEYCRTHDHKVEKSIYFFRKLREIGYITDIVGRSVRLHGRVGKLYLAVLGPDAIEPEETAID